MVFESGVGLLAVTLLLFGCAYGVMRRPVPRPWADNEGFATAVCVVLTGLVAATVGAWTQAILQYEHVLAGLGLLEVAAGLGILAAAFFGMRLLAAPARRKARPVAGALKLGMPEDLSEPANHNATGMDRAA